MNSQFKSFYLIYVRYKMFSAMVDDVIKKIAADRNIDFVQGREIFDNIIDMIQDFPLDADSIVQENIGIKLNEFYEILEQ